MQGGDSPWCHKELDSTEQLSTAQHRLEVGIREREKEGDDLSFLKNSLNNRVKEYKNRCRSSQANFLMAQRVDHSNLTQGMAEELETDFMETQLTGVGYGK